MRFTKPTGITLLFLVAFCVTFSAIAQAPAAPPAPAAAPPAAKAAPAPPAPPAAPAPPAPAAPPEKTFDKAQTSYALGNAIATNLEPLSTNDIDMENFTKGFADKIAGKPATMQDSEVQQAVMGLIRSLSKKKVDVNKAEEEKYLAENGKKEGVTTLPSGLQYKIIKAGTGPKPTAADMVKVDYKGSFADGKEFDSSAKHGGQPATLPVGGVIKGWTEALQLMPVGSTWQLAIPSSLAYGEQGRPPQMPPSKMLIFEVTLVEIMPKAPEAKPGAVTLPNQPATTQPAPKPATVKPAEPAKGSS